MRELTPCRAVPDARVAIWWYGDVLGAEVVHEPVEMPDGRSGPVELAVDGARWMMSDAHPGTLHVAPGADGSPVMLHRTLRDPAGHRWFRTRPHTRPRD